MLTKRAKYAGECWVCGKAIPKGTQCDMERAGWPDPYWRISCIPGQHAPKVVAPKVKSE